MSMCPMCSMGLRSSCQGGSCGQTEPLPLTEERSLVETHSLTPIRIGTTNEDKDDRGSRRRGGRGRSKRSLGDSQSSGRKIAAKLYPLNGSSPCEWQGKSNCGGGNYPILGCPTGVESYQQARHHGPEKNVQNNEQGNVHRICHYCHYRWHAANDPTYDWNAGVWPAHDPKPFTDKEQTKQVIDYMRYLAVGKRKKQQEVVD